MTEPTTVILTQDAPARYVRGLFFAVVAILVVYRIAVLLILDVPLFYDEAYYFGWAQELAFGYDTFMLTHPEVGTNAVHVETYIRYRGSEFGDRILGSDIEAFEIPSGVTEVSLPAAFNPLLLTQDTDDSP